MAHEGVVRILVGADPATASTVGSLRGCTPLHFAAYNGIFEMVKLLLEAAPDNSHNP